MPPARYRPLRSLDCFPSFAEQGQGGLQLDLQRVLPGLVEEVEVEEVRRREAEEEAWGPDLGVMAAPRHDERVRRAVERLFFTEEALGGVGFDVLGVLSEEGGIA